MIQNSDAKWTYHFVKRTTAANARNFGKQTTTTANARNAANARNFGKQTTAANTRNAAKARNLANEQLRKTH
jgi:hypothetical protein